MCAAVAVLYRRLFASQPLVVIINIDESKSLTRAGPLLGAERAGPGGGGDPPSNSAPVPCSGTRQAAFERV